MEIGKLIIFQILISSGKLKMQEMHCILLVFYIGATFFCAREAWEMLYFTCIYTTGGARQNDGGYPNDIFPRFFRQRDVRKFGPRDAVFTSIQRRSTGVDFSPLEQANKSLLHALTVVGFIRFPLATRMRRLSKPKLHSYSVFPCARLAVAAVRVVELQLRRSLDRFGGPSLRHRACGA